MHNEEAPTRNPSSVMGFIGFAIALPPPSVHEVRLEVICLSLGSLLTSKLLTVNR